MNKLILGLSVVVFSISCSSNDDENVPTDPVVEIPVLPTKLSFSNDTPATVKYDGNKNQKYLMLAVSLFMSTLAISLQELRNTVVQA